MRFIYYHYLASRAASRLLHHVGVLLFVQLYFLFVVRSPPPPYTLPTR